MVSFINSTKTTNWILIGLVVVAIVGAGYWYWHKKHVEAADAVLVDVEHPEEPAQE